MAAVETSGPRVEIDEFRLDEEWIGQPKEYLTWSRKLADAQRKLDQTKSALDLKRADLDADIRSDPAAYDITKITEKAVENHIIADPLFQKATKDVIEAKHDVGIIKAAVDALEHRKHALESLVKLHGQGYFAACKADGEDKEAMDVAEKRAIRRRGKK